MRIFPSALVVVFAVAGLSGKQYADTLRGRVRLQIERAGQLDLGDPDHAATLAP